METSHSFYSTGLPPRENIELGPLQHHRVIPTVSLWLESLPDSDAEGSEKVFLFEGDSAITLWMNEHQLGTGLVICFSRFLFFLFLSETSETFLVASSESSSGHF